MPSPRRNGRAKCPTVLQMEAVECGAASLSILLGYYKRYVPLEELRQKCGVSRDGSKASNILKAARGYGLEATGYKYSAEQVREGPFPFIAWWNQNHFLVVEGMKGTKVFLNDPATGPRVCTFGEFSDSFTKVALFFTPAADFQTGGNPPRLVSALLPRLSAYKPAVAFFMLSALFLVIPGLAVPAFTRIFIDEVIVSSREEWLRPLLLGMGMTAIITMVLTWFQERNLLRYQTLLNLSESARFFRHVLRLPTSFFSQRFGGEVGQRVMINDRIAHMVAEKMPQVGVDLLRTGFFGLLMFFYDGKLALATIGLALLNFGVIKAVARLRLDNNRRLLQDEGKLTATAMGGLQMIETIKGTGGEEEFFSRWSGYQAKTLGAKQKLGFYNHVTMAVPPLVEALSTAIILGFGGWIVMTSGSGFTIGMLVAFQSVAQNFTKPFNDIVNFAGQVQELQGDMARIDDVMAHEQDPIYRQRATSSKSVASKLSGHIELRNIVFGYNPLGKPLIEDLNLTIRPGQRIALVGGSGSGKSTVAKIVSGLYQPWSGTVAFDGIAREELPADVVNATMAVVDQEIFLFEGTIRDNLSMWDATISDQVLTEALRDAHMLHKIAERIGGLSSPVEENGQNFSGGERQRLEIARALVAGPRFLILDEATSALDPPTEKAIETNLMRRGCSCLIVAHRLSTIRDCDEIIVMEQGKVVERGNHEALVALGGTYSQLIKQ